MIVYNKKKAEKIMYKRMKFDAQLSADTFFEISQLGFHAVITCIRLSEDNNYFRWLIIIVVLMQIFITYCKQTE